MPRTATPAQRRTHPNRIWRFSFAVLGVALAITLGFAYFPTKSRAASGTTTEVRGVERPLFGLKNPAKVKVSYKGSPDFVRALEAGAARPTCMAAADFDLDGAVDLVLGYRTSGGGLVALLRGNPNAFAPKDQNLYRAALRGDVLPTFLPSAAIFRVPESPDFLATGDFDRDGYQDVLLGTRNGGLYLLEGDGRGNLQEPRAISLPGKVRALAVTSAGQVAVGIDGPAGPRLLIFAPSRSGLISAATYTLPAPATSIAWGALGGEDGTDLAVSSGASAVVIYEAFNSRPRRVTIQLGFHAKALALGDFIWDRNGTTEIAVLGDDGMVRILQHGSLDTRPLTAAELSARQATRPRPTAVGRWTIAKRLGFAMSSSSGVAAQFMLQSPRLTASPTHDLMILDVGQSKISIFDTSKATSSASAMLKLPGPPVAAFATPQTLDGGRDLVVLTSSQVEPVIIHSGTAASVNVTTTTDTDRQNACTNKTIMPKDLRGTISLRTAVCAADNYGAMGSVAINVPLGNYQLTSLDTGELQLGLVPGSNISVIGTGTAANTIIEQTDGVDRVLNFDPNLVGNVTGAVFNVTVTGGKVSSLGGGGMLAGFIGDSYTITNAVFVNNTSSGTSASGGGINLRGGSLSMTNCTITNNTAEGNVGGGIAITNGTGSRGDVSLINTAVTSNTSTASGSSPGRGGGVFTDVDTGSSASISGSTVMLNIASGSPGQGGGIFNQGAPLSVVNSRVVSNQAGDAEGIYTQGSNATATDNWWGCNEGPGSAGCDTVDGLGGTVSVNPWLVLSISASPTQIQPLAMSALSVDLTHDSSGRGGFTVPTGTTVSLKGTLGTVNPAQTILANGIAASTYTAGSDPGAGQATATVDNQSASVIIDIVHAPAIINHNHTTFIVGKAGSFQITTAGFPLPTITENGTLPNGVTFKDNGNGTGTLAGFPTAGGGGNYKLTFGAQNGVPPNAQQNFTLTIHESPAIVSPEHTSFQVGTAGSFTVTTKGYPTSNISHNGTIPQGVTFVDNHNGTGTLSGTPAADTGKNYFIGFTAANGVIPNALQHFKLQVSQAPAITSADNTHFMVGTAGSFTVTTTGFPNPSIFETGLLPSGVQFVDNHNGTGTLSGTSAIAGTFNAELWAANNGGSAEQNFMLTVLKGNSSTGLSSSTNPSVLNQNVVFTATVSSNGTGAPTGKVKILDGETELGESSLDGNGAAKLPIASLAAGTHSITAAYLGDGNYASSASPTVGQVVIGAPQFRLTADPGALTLEPGTPARFTITATAQNGFHNAVLLACSSSTMPEGATCQFSPPSITPGANPATSALTIMTTAPASAQATSSFKKHQPSSVYVIWLVMPGLLVSTVGLGGSRWRSILVYCLTLVLVAGCLIQSACSNATKTGGESIGTSPGTYQIVVTGTSNAGTSNAMTQTTAISMIVP